jgi:hypothetical protein
MGLDITAYKGLSKLDVVYDDDGEPLRADTHEPIEDYIKAWENPDFPGRIEGIEDGAIYAFEDAVACLGLGYGGYSQWRDALAKLAGYPLTPYKSYGMVEHSHAAACWDPNGAKGPFCELINFADNEGTIGPVVCAKLLKDFDEFEERAKAVGGHFWSVYMELHAGLRLAAQGGCLQFH